MGPRHAPLAVQLHKPLHADGSDWAAAVRLRERVRERVACGCGEPLPGAPPLRRSALLPALP